MATYQYVLGPLQLSRPGGPESPLSYRAPEGCVGWIDLRSISQQALLGNALLAMPISWIVPSEYTLLGGGTGDIRTLSFTAFDQSAWQSLIGVRPKRSSETTLVDALTETLTDLSDPLGLNNCPPLMPGVDSLGQIQSAEIILGGHSVIQQIPAPKLGIGAWGSNIKDLLTKSLDDLEAKIVINRQADHWKKYWGDLSRAWFGTFDNPKSIDLLSTQLKAKYPNVKPEKPKTTHSDNFNGSDSATLGVQLTWTEVAGAWEILSNQEKYKSSQTYGAARAEHDLSSSNNEATLTVITLTDNSSFSYYNYLGPACRYHATNGTNYHILKFDSWTGNTNEHSLRKWSGTVGTVLGTPWTGVDTPPTTMKVVANGSTIELWVETTLRVTVTDTTYATGLRGGIASYMWVIGDGNIGDNFSTNDLAAAAAASLPIFPRRLRSFAFRG